MYITIRKLRSSNARDKSLIQIIALGVAIIILDAMKLYVVDHNVRTTLGHYF